MKKYARSKTSIIQQLNYISICLCTKGSTSACFPFTAFSSRFLYLIVTSFFLTFCLLRLPSFQYVNAKIQNWIENFKTSVKATSSQRHSDCFSQYVSFELPVAVRSFITIKTMLSRSQSDLNKLTRFRWWDPLGVVVCHYLYLGYQNGVL